MTKDTETWFERLRVKLPELAGVKVVAIASIAISSLLLGMRHQGWLQPFELNAYDRISRMRPDAPPDPRLLIVAITEQDIQIYNRWPLSDNTIAQALQKLQAMQPQVIGLGLYRDIRYEPGHEELKTQLQADNVIAITKLPDAQTTAVPPPPSVPQSRVGFNDLVLDPDGIVRRNLMYGTTSDGPIFSFGLLLAMTYLNPQGIELGVTPEGQIKLGNAVFERLTANTGGYQTIDEQGYQTLLYYRSRRSAARQVSLTDVVYGRVNPDWVKGKIVLIGTTALSGKDLFDTPYSASERVYPKMPGVSIHAQIVSQILSTILDDRPAIGWWPEWAEISWIVSWAIAGGILGWRLRHPLAQIGTVITLLSILVASATGLGMGLFPLIRTPIWIPLSTPILAFGLTGATVLTARSYAAGRQQQIVMKLLGQNTSPEIAQALWKSRDRLVKSGTLPGQKLIATMLFADIRDFSTISEQMPPEQLLEWLNEFLGAISAEVTRHQGIINKFTGDGIMAVFGVPVARHSLEEIAADAQRAVACALGIGNTLQLLNESFSKRNLPVVSMRIGIFTGPVVAGSLGGKERLEYGVIGDSVNIASRLESCEKNRQPSNCRVLIAKETLQHLQDRFVVEAWGPLILKGKQQAVEVFRVVGWQDRTDLIAPNLKINSDPEQSTNSLSLQ